MKKTIHQSLALGLPTLLLCLPAPAGDAVQVGFKSADGLEITADLYLVSKDKQTPFIVLFHQAGWSRGEYHEIAPRLNELGYNCLAVDARSGGEVNDTTNATAARAKKRKLGTSYVDALPDLVASLEYARKEYAKGKLIAWGSSYSSALVLKVTGDHPELVDGVLSFSPGEYFTRLGQPADWIQRSAKKIRCPAFITSAKMEKSSWQTIYDAIPKGKKTSYLPETKGNHGSRALWQSFDDSAGYWTAVETFLAGSFPVAKVPAAQKTEK